ncbi:MAG: biotin carboxylase N-terminal domain-containing protein [Planctomycetota bacterium]
MFHRVLIANRGEVAVRIARTLRALGIVPIGIASRPDLAMSWTGAMEEVVCVGEAAAGQSYLDMERIVQAARQTRCSALHPGWGFLAENKRFAALCHQHGLVFIGPPAAAMALMGVKSPAKAAMRRAGLDVVPGSDGPLPDANAAAACAARIGYPAILKADFGGGGRGMRLCRDEAELREAFGAAAAEAAAAFGSGSLYLERYLAGGRHIEVQVLCDSHGNAIHVGERECSIQRKHQKLIEESPSPALGDAERAALGERAARAAARLGYRNAGTIEFLRAASGELYFMEMNTRLQVEHPVSEMVSGLDIVAEQVRIAANHPLGRTQDEVKLAGHAIECRINAEDPAAGFRPAPGRLEVFAFATGAGPGTVRVDTHLAPGDEVTPHYDSLLAKVIAHGATRAKAIATMIAALSGSRVEGVKTTIPMHLAVLASDAFRRGEYDTLTIPGWRGGGA